MKIFKGLLGLCLTFMTFMGCGINTGVVRSVDATKYTLTGEDGIVVGKVKFMVDGKELNYNLLNRPIMRLFRYSNGQYYETPMVDDSGAFSWKLPEGEYEIAVLFGGLSPVGQPMLMRDTGAYWYVNGFTYPGYRLSSATGKTYYLGTLVVDVNSREMKALINFTGERVFGSLNRMEIVDESEIDQKWQSLKDLPGAAIQLIEPIRPQSSKIGNGSK